MAYRGSLPLMDGRDRRPPVIPRVLEPEVMDTVEEATGYNSMDHSEVNRLFVDHLLAEAREVWESSGGVLVLDVGTGTALIPIELCSRDPLCRVTAIDLSAEMLKVGRENCGSAGVGDRVTLQHVDAKGLPFADDCFDVVMSNSIVHHIPDPIQVMREMRRVLKPGGLLFVRDLMRPNSSDAVEAFVETYAGTETDHQRQMFRQSLHAALTVNEMRQLLLACDLPDDWVTATSDRHWTICGILPD